MSYKIFTSESVCSGHPDKICDQISDAILDECLKQDVSSRVAVETLVTTNNIILAGEVTSKAKVNLEKIARNVVKDLGYDQKIFKFDYKSAKVHVFIHSQSPDIAAGVETGGAGDQGMMFGYACDETSQLMPLPIRVAHQITRKIDETRESTLKYLRPDGKSEVTFGYVHGKPKEVLKVITAVPHDPKISEKKVARDIYEIVVRPALKKFGFEIEFKNTICNGTGKWEIGGPASDTGVTGRKIVVDSYGGMARIGGGCFSGKDPTKVDRSGAYATRFIAKNIVACGMARRCEMQIAYVIGKPDPVSRSIETFGTEKVALSKIESFANKLIDLSVLGIIQRLNLRRPIYRETATYGHFGNPKHAWEQIM
ncbi:methionine adenosyltransferase [Candidatus Curtissbacteria bacterium RIFCSPHIGHO2_02_FULL_40_17]|uniref:Methionine adenosyltransferase n=3 Tax=Candidatus Curtissiibacteriota TaxID=1752717 RepID=A0A1F5GJF9_9BACT|nr:MAG: methionine adenosyltransferase [Candidatus Curtissbacteria bacterium RIFCSPHIGHO2_02_FULL_40_17]OGE03683.1 MAG: methionine adenosyltransferase [Candidatus Curtissbacteria bacterium RIFCSPHIGHO2_12_FULL_41_17]OGE07327.1 MAG: methionine adenosyltransferase [Candidatus Curtissbacteria bacterium RIFCSPLOWO2_02_FULL_40_13b]